METFIDAHSGREVLVRSPQVASLRRILSPAAEVRAAGVDGLVVTGMDAAAIGARAAATGVELHELTPRQPSLEQAFMDLTRDALEYRAEDTTNATHSAQETSR